MSSIRGRFGNDDNCLRGEPGVQADALLDFSLIKGEGANFGTVSHAIKYKHFCDYPSNCNNAIASAEVKMIRFKSRIIYLSPISKVTAGGSAFELLMPIPACQQEAIQVVIIFCK